MDFSTFSNNLKILQKERRLYGKQIAEGTGLTGASISTYLQGGTPTISAVCALAAFFGVSVQWLLFGGSDRGYHYTLDEDREFLEAYCFAEELDRKTVDLFLSRYGGNEND